MFTLQEITAATQGEWISAGQLPDLKQTFVQEISIDSRTHPMPGTLFFALRGERHDGHHYVEDSYRQGTRFFVVEQKGLSKTGFQDLPLACFCVVKDSLVALQDLAAMHRRKFSYPVLAITGSNGKTQIKEWVSQLLSECFSLVRSPKSFNSQVGVPLSVFKMNDAVQLGIFEAGISLPGEMERLEKIIHPTIGLVANIGDAHQENFSSLEEKLREKLRLFEHAEVIVYNTDQTFVAEQIRNNPALSDCVHFTWGEQAEANLRIIPCSIAGKYDLQFQLPQGQTKTFSLQLNALDYASVQNSFHSLAAAYCVLLGRSCVAPKRFPEAVFRVVLDQMAQLVPVAMRLDLREGVNGCSLINDSYNSDVNSLKIALDFLQGFRKGQARTVILSDILQSGMPEKELYQQLAQMLEQSKVERVIGVGPALIRYAEWFVNMKQVFASTDELLLRLDRKIFNHEAILIKGSRSFKFEKISSFLEARTHLTTLEVNLSTLVDNLNYYKRKLKPGVGILVMVKANAYGHGLHEVSRLLNQHGVDYLGVAFADEGVSLREAGITTPIMVMNPEPGTFEQLLAYNLEPEIYSFDLLRKWNRALLREGIVDYPIHIKLDTGMHRLGFMQEDIPELIERLKQSPGVKPVSVFSHLAAADEPELENFTQQQFQIFERMSQAMLAEFPVKRHLLNSSGTDRYPDHQYEMVRLGLGFYGVSAVTKEKVKTACSLKSTLVQIKNIPAGECIGYACQWKALSPMQIGIVPLGYGDGLNRRLSNGVGQVYVAGHHAPIVGNISMDSCMIDLSGLQVKEGDEVEFFGRHIAVETVAERLQTIPYEVWCNVAQRVKRVYYTE